MLEFFSGNAGFRVHNIEDLKKIVEEDLMEGIIDILYTLNEAQDIEGVLDIGETTDDIVNQIEGLIKLEQEEHLLSEKQEEKPLKKERKDSSEDEDWGFGI